MPRVLRIINRLNLGGPTFNAAYLTRYLQPEFETMLVSGVKDDTEASSEFILENLGIQPVYIPEMKRDIDFKNDRIAYKKIKKIIEEFKPDIVHTHAAKAGTLGRLAAYNAGVPVVLHTFHGHVFHSYFSPLKTKLFIAIERYLAGKSSAIIAISPEQRKELSEVYKVCPFDKIHTVPLGFDLDKFGEDKEAKRKSFRSEYLVNDEEVVITIVGRLVPVKNHEMFLKGIARLLSMVDVPVRAFIVGDGESRGEIESVCAGLNLDFTDALKEKRRATVTFTSWRKDIDVVCAGSDIITLTSRNEGTPVSLIEAQAAARPIVSTEVGGIRDIMAENAGLLCKSEDDYTFAELLKRLCENKEERLLMGQKGPKYTREVFSYQRLCSDMAELYRSLLKEKAEKS